MYIESASVLKTSTLWPQSEFMCFTWTPEIRAIITKKVLEALWDIKIEHHVIITVKYTDDPELLANEETVLQVTTDKLIEIGKCCGMEMNVEKTKVMGNSSNYLQCRF
jgi:hypothetical protein